MITVKEIVRRFLDEHKATGLVGDNCGCEINDLMPCDGECSGCIVGYKIIKGSIQCKSKIEECDHKEDCSGKNAFCIFPLTFDSKK
jgi:hypothetical protein